MRRDVEKRQVALAVGATRCLFLACLLARMALCRPPLRSPCQTRISSWFVHSRLSVYEVSLSSTYYVLDRYVRTCLLSAYADNFPRTKSPRY